MKKAFLLVLIFVSIAVLAHGKDVLVQFKYKNTTVETKETADGGIEKTVRDFGQPSLNQQLLDLIVFKLIEKKHNATVDQFASYEYKVLIDPIFLHVTGGNDYSIEIEIYGKGALILKRQLIRGNKPFRDCTEDLSNEIADYIVRTIK
ncbi:MAG: hypothetical protein JW969_06315 [Spirochaetales bacterium]|nr:hypothetical protein [Spirochaetales bacterium]